MARNKKTKIAKLVPIALVVIGLLVIGFLSLRDDPKTSDGTPVNLGPPTKEEQQAGDQQKEAIVKREEALSQGNVTPSSAQVVITETSKSGVKGYISNIYEEGGTCTATATKGSQTITGTSTGFQNVSYTQCAPIRFDTELSSGIWQITLSYKSPTATGSTSKSMEIN